jgi:hypothetical protein
LVQQDYEEFDLANEIDELDKFLKISVSVSTAEITLANTADSKVPVENGELNGIASSREVSDVNIDSLKSYCQFHLVLYLITCNLTTATEFS